MLIQHANWIRATGELIIKIELEMPQMGGIEATRCIRQMDERVRNIPIIVLTAHATAGDAERSKTAGADDHLASR
jgi:CheY-like chemotaxis protein